MQSRGRSGEKSFHCAFKPSPFERLNQFTFKFNPDEDCQKKVRRKPPWGRVGFEKKTFFLLLLSVANRLDRMELFPLHKKNGSKNNEAVFRIRKSGNYFIWLLRRPVWLLATLLIQLYFSLATGAPEFECFFPLKVNSVPDCRIPRTTISQGRRHPSEASLVWFARVAI